MSNEDGKDDIREGFRRQRRNLLIVSLVLLFSETAELTISELNLFGNVVHLANPATITYALWVAYLYWLWRYYTYFHDLSNRNILATYRYRLYELIKQIGFRKLCRDSVVTKRLNQTDVITIDRNTTIANTMLIPRSLTRFEIRVKLYGTKASGYSGEIDNIDFFYIKAPMSIIAAHVVAWGHVFFRTSLVSEYLLPFCIALLPVGYKLYVITTI